MSNDNMTAPNVPIVQFLVHVQFELTFIFSVYSILVESVKKNLHKSDWKYKKNTLDFPVYIVYIYAREKLMSSIFWNSCIIIVNNCSADNRDLLCEIVAFLK